MKLTLAAAAGLMALGLTASAAGAAPLSGNMKPEGESLVTPVWTYHSKCVWVNHGWHYHHKGKYLVCRPHKPHGHGWHWYSHEGKHGWYHKKHHWHHKKW
jgi:hypothetical protein